MTTEPNRQPEGVPTGGQYAAKVKSDDVPALGSLPAPKIMATVNLQRWVDDDGAEPVGQVDFDAGRILADMAQEKRSAIFDGDGSGDDVFHEAVRRGLVEDHDGPFEVYVRDAMDEALEADPDVFEKIAALPNNRPAGAILDTPLSAYELGARADDDGFVSGLAVMDMSNLIDNDLDQHNDAIGEALAGSSLLMQPVATPVAVQNGQIVMQLEGDASAIIENFDDEELAQYEAGRAARTTEGA
jgi:hypothetical protein